MPPAQPAQPPGGIALAKRRPALDGELIEGQVIAGKFKHAAQLAPPLRVGLAWPRVDQIKGHAVKNLASLGHGRLGLSGVMASAQESERVVIQGLNAQ